MVDLISRQAAIKYLITNMNWYDEDGYESDDDYKRECITELINGVPSAQPEQDIEHCATCVHDEDSVEICVLRNCKYAIAELIDCYEPKQPERKKEDEHETD